MTQFQPPPSTLQPGSHVVAYLRDSGGREQDLSIDRQEIELRRWAAEHGLILTKPYIDEARTGRTDHKRDALQYLMNHFRRGAQERGVIIWNYDRFARNVTNARLYLAELETLGIVFHSLTDYIPEGPERVIFEAVYIYQAEQYSNKLSVNVVSGLRNIVEQYGAMPGFPPAGFRREPLTIGTRRDGAPHIVHKWVPDPEKIPLVQRAFEMRAKGATLKQIQDITRLYTSINSWVTFFNNRLYLGELHFGDLVIKDYCEAVVDRETWDAANRTGKLRSKIRKGYNPKRLASSFLLSGLVYCQHCGTAMNGRVVRRPGRNKHHYYYACPRRTRRRDCPSRDIPRDALDSAVIDALETIALDLENLLAIQSQLKSQYAEIARLHNYESRALERDHKALKKKIERITNAIADHGHSTALMTKLHALEVEEAEILSGMAGLNMDRYAIPDHDETTLSQLAEQLKASLHNEDEKRLIIRSMISRVVALREESAIRGVVYYIPPQVCLGGSTPAQTRTALFGSGGRRSVH